MATTLLAEAGDALDAGVDPQAVHDQLAEHPGVVASTWDETGVQFRVEGAPVVVAFSPLASPEYNAALELARTGRLPLAGDTRAEGSGASSTAQLQLATSGTTREAGLRPRSALVLRPWQRFDLTTMRRQLVAAGELGADEEPDWDAFAAMVGATEQVLRDSHHISVTTDDTLAGFQSFAQYDLVLVATHSSSFRTNTDDDGARCDPALGHVCGPVLGGPLLFPDGVVNEGVDEALRTLQYRQLERLPIGATIGRILGQWTIAMTPEFFEEAYPEPHSAVVILNACKTGNDTIPVTGQARRLAAVGSNDLFTWDNAIDALQADATTALLVEILLGSGLSTEAAFSHLERSGDVTEHTFGRGRETASLVRLQRRDTRVRDAVIVQHRGDEMQPGAVLQVVGTPEDGQNDQLRRLDVRIDGVLVDSTDDVDLHWRIEAKHADPFEVPRVLTSDEATVTGVTDEDDDGSVWRDHLVSFEDLDLGVDLERDDLSCCREHALVVEVRERDGRTSEHRIEPVFLRTGSVEVLDPDLGQPLEAEAVVALDGTANDGDPELYPVVVSLDDIDEELVEDLVLEVQVGDVPLSVPGREWQRVEDGRYRVDRTLELFDFEHDEVPVAVTATVELPELEALTFEADPVILQLDPSGCDYLTGAEVGSAMGRAFADPIDLGEEFSFLLGVCRWEAERSTVEISLVRGEQVERLRQLVADGHPTAVGGFGDAATYDLLSGNALHPSGIEGDDGQIQYTNFVNLAVAIDDRVQATIHVQGNVVIEEGPETGLLDRLRALAEVIRERV